MLSASMPKHDLGFGLEGAFAFLSPWQVLETIVAGCPNWLKPGGRLWLVTYAPNIEEPVAELRIKDFPYGSLGASQGQAFHNQFFWGF